MADRRGGIEQVQALHALRRHPRFGATMANSLFRTHDGDSLDIDTRGDVANARAIVGRPKQGK